MALIYPCQTKTGHWNGALQARLTRAPLEQFLAAAHVKIAYGGSRDSDNLARATVCVIDSGLRIYFSDRDEGLAESQHSMIGRLACVVSRTIAAQILQPDAWRIPALLGAAQVLTPWIGLNAAACASASSIHEFTASLTHSSAQQADVETGELVSVAIENSDPDSILALARKIAARLSGEPQCAAAQEPIALLRAVAAP